MNRIVHSKKAFTLIELLVVVAILGLVATLSLTAIAHYRDQAKDVRVEMVLSQIIKLASIIHGDSDSYESICDDDDNTLNETDSSLANIEADIERFNSTNVCYDTQNTFCVSATLVRSGTYCVDSTGYSGTDKSTCDDSVVCH